MTQQLPHFNATTMAGIGTIIDTMLQQRMAAFQITYDEKKRIPDTAKLIAELLHGASDPHFHAIAHYQINSIVYTTKTLLTLEITYLEDLTQLNYVKQKTQQIITQITTPSMHLHQKIMAIHDWITTNVQYDQSLKRRTAFDGLHYKSTVCSGYASLFWHLCNAAAIPCRVVTGIGKFEAHAWNMVQLDNYWYHIDSTWSTVEDQHTPFSVYRFYLLNDKELQHTHKITQLPGQKPFPHSHMQYREHLHQLGRALPRLRNTIQQIQQKTGLAYLEPEYTVVGIAQLHKRIVLACQKRQSRVLFGYRGAETSAKHDLRDVLESLKAQKIYNFSLKAMMYPMPHGFTDDTVLMDVQITYT